MVIKAKSQSGPIEIDLTGPDGNAYALLGYGHNFAKQLGIDFKPIREK